MSTDTPMQSTPVSTAAPTAQTQTAQNINHNGKRTSPTTEPSITVKAERGYNVMCDFTHYYTIPVDYDSMDASKVVIENIPKLFHHVIRSLQILTKQRNLDVDVIALCDKRLIRPITDVHTAPVSVNKAVQLFDDNGMEYTVTAARKELLKLFYEVDGNKELGLLNRLKICPKLIVLHSVNGDNRTIVTNAYETCRCAEYYVNDDKSTKIYMYDTHKKPVSPSNHTLKPPSNIKTDQLHISPLNKSLNHTTPPVSQPDSATSIISSQFDSAASVDPIHNDNTALHDATQHASTNSLSVQLPNAGSQRYITTLKNQIENMNETIGELRTQLADQKQQTQHWKTQWSYERNNTVKLWDRLDGLKQWLNRGFKAVPTPASQIYTAPQRKNTPKSNITDYITIDNSSDEQVLRSTAEDAIRSTDEQRTVPLSTNTPVDPLADQPSITNPKQTVNTDTSLLSDDVMSINQSTPTSVPAAAQAINIEPQQTIAEALPVVLNNNETVMAT